MMSRVTGPGFLGICVSFSLFLSLSLFLATTHFLYKADLKLPETQSGSATFPPLSSSRSFFFFFETDLH